jgi:hypothetical protein
MVNISESSSIIILGQILKQFWVHFIIHIKWLTPAISWNVELVQKRFYFSFVWSRVIKALYCIGTVFALLYIFQCLLIFLFDNFKHLGHCVLSCVIVHVHCLNVGFFYLSFDHLWTESSQTLFLQQPIFVYFILQILKPMYRLLFVCRRQ